MKYIKHKENPTSFKKGQVPWNKGQKGLIPWNKGMTKETDIRVAGYAKTLSIKGICPPKPDIETQEKMRKDARERWLGAKNPSKNIEILKNRKPSGINQYSNYFTSIEKQIAEELNSRNIPYIHNYRIGPYFADFLIFDRVVIECDGRYWHKDKHKEKRREKYLHNNGYYTFHLEEKRIKGNPKECIDTIDAVIESLFPPK